MARPALVPPAEVAEVAQPLVPPKEVAAAGPSARQPEGAEQPVAAAAGAQQAAVAEAVLPAVAAEAAQPAEAVGVAQPAEAAAGVQPAEAAVRQQGAAAPGVRARQRAVVLSAEASWSCRPAAGLVPR